VAGAPRSIAVGHARHGTIVSLKETNVNRIVHLPKGRALVQ
jgi:hypothetical protein